MTTRNLCRALDVPVEFRAEADGANTITMEFARWNEWTEISSPYEGRFFERVAPGAFDAAFAPDNPRPPKVMFDHGRHAMIGNFTLGKTRSFENTRSGAVAVVDLHDAPFMADLEPQMRAGDMGASFRWVDDDNTSVWTQPSRATNHNPNKLPERTLVQIPIVEFGPTPFGAYPNAGMRSLTEDWHESLLDDPKFVARLTERFGARVVERVLSQEHADGGTAEPTVLAEHADGGTHPSILRARIHALTLR